METVFQLHFKRQSTVQNDGQLFLKTASKKISICQYHSYCANQFAEFTQYFRFSVGSRNFDA